MSEPLIIVSQAFSGKGNEALVAVRIDGIEVKMTADRAEALAMEVKSASVTADLETDFYDFLVHGWKMDEGHARTAVSEFRVHRANRERAKRNERGEVQGRMLGEARDIPPA